jgi:hypothetical protein
VVPRRVREEGGDTDRPLSCLRLPVRPPPIPPLRLRRLANAPIEHHYRVSQSSGEERCNARRAAGPAHDDPRRFGAQNVVEVLIGSSLAEGEALWVQIARS